jgi:hypothetical protein
VVPPSSQNIGGRVVGVAAGVLAEADAFGRASVWHSAGSATLEQRIQTLERNLTNIRDDLREFQNRTEADIRRQAESLKQEQQARESADQAIREKVRATETGGLHISAMGAIWLLVGLTMSTIAVELARWFGQ